MNAVLQKAIKSLSSITIWASATIICHCESLVQSVSNTNSVDSPVIQLQATATVLAMSVSILIVWAPGHCGMSGNELVDHQANLGAAVTKPDNTFDAATQIALIHRSCRPPPI